MGMYAWRGVGKYEYMHMCICVHGCVCCVMEEKRNENEASMPSHATPTSADSESIHAA